MKEVLENLFGFIYSLSMGDYFFFIGTFLLIILFIYILYLIKCSDEEKSVKDENTDDLFDLASVSEDIEKNYKPAAIKLTSYEEEQENNAIISYDELVKTQKLKKVSYDDEYTSEIPELNVKKIDLNNIGNSIIEEPKLEVKLMSYEKEEEFLAALKTLQNNLSH